AVRAVLGAAACGPVRMLIPLVTTSELLDFVLSTVARAEDELTRAGLEFAKDVPLGAMIEVAAAAPMVPAWAGEVAYFALGTNDLTASALGLGRDDAVVAADADPLHPGMVRLIDRIVTDAHAAGKPVTVC